MIIRTPHALPRWTRIFINGETGRTAQPIGQEGFVLPVVIFAMAILAVLAMAALSTANDEHHASRAMRESGMALYAAEAGAHMILD